MALFTRINMFNMLWLFQQRIIDRVINLAPHVGGYHIFTNPTVNPSPGNRTPVILEVPSFPHWIGVFVECPVQVSPCPLSSGHLTKRIIHPFSGIFILHWEIWRLNGWWGVLFLRKMCERHCCLAPADRIPTTLEFYHRRAFRNSALGTTDVRTSLAHAAILSLAGFCRSFFSISLLLLLPPE